MWRESGRQQSRVFTDEASARKWRALLDVIGPTRALAMLEAPAPTTTTLTVAEQVHAHIDGLTGVTNGTRTVYTSHLRRIIAPTRLGRMPIALLRVADVADWVNDLDAAGTAPKTIANYHGLLSAALSTAVRDELIPSNPSTGMRLPRGAGRDEMVFLTPDEFAQLHAAMHPHYQPLLMVLAGTGMRFGEATALRVADIDPVGRSARITRAWKYTGTAAREIGSPKTTRSTRTAALPPEVLAVLPLAGRRRDEYLLTAPKGGVIRQPVFFTSWKRAAAVLECHPRIHDLRHTFASWAIQAGIPLPVIQRQLGHESITTTVDRYGHLARADFDALAAATSLRLGRQTISPR